MKFAVFGTGMVGRTIANRLNELGHDVTIGTRDVSATLARTEGDSYGNPPFSEWQVQHSTIALASFSDASNTSDYLINATSGESILTILSDIDEAMITGKILIDIANPLDFSNGMPPSLSVVNTDSLGEKIQRNFPDIKVVKTLNTMNADLMANPMLLNQAHDVFISGDDADAKQFVIELLQSFGWQEPIDLGGITSARGTEMILPIWLQLYSVLQTPMFNFKVVR